jgi:hypothetical protein
MPVRHDAGPGAEGKDADDEGLVFEGDPTDLVDPDHPDAVSPLIDARSGPQTPLRRVPPPAQGEYHFGFVSLVV